MHDCHSEYIVSCFGSFLAEPNICICMEFMDKGSFDVIYKRIGAIDINVVCMVAHSVLEGLMYLYDVHRIIHRGVCVLCVLALCDIDLTIIVFLKRLHFYKKKKISSHLIYCVTHIVGSIKLSDFGVSGELIIPWRTHLWGPQSMSVCMFLPLSDPLTADFVMTSAPFEIGETFL